MKVGIDISSLHTMSKGRGIGFYAQYLVDSLRKYTQVDVIVFEAQEKREKVDLIHYPFFDFFRPTLKIVKDIPTVVTIHDVIPLLFPRHYPAGIKGKINLFRQKQSLKKVKAVITDSDASTKDVIKCFKLSKNVVSTIYLAPANHFKKLPDSETKKTISKFNFPDRYILYSGGINWNKNLIVQTKAALETGLDLVFVGNGFQNKDNLNHPELKDFKEFLSRYENNARVHILGFVLDNELVALMNGARALIFASRYEGFGLPILEAQSCGTPVVTSNISSMVEVAGDGAEIVDPNSGDSINMGLNKILENNKYSQEIVKKGFENLKRFSWEKTALQTVKVYQNALS
jgi:glycosyltransferase involved in cell wall biosynthesis